ncbi:hypothetical protein J2T09_001651 [Neorhizobium huautlense]|uniref:DUF2783 domain-containing protein n=1 Tax=Neorhizobium huautlense TaxID=67774 RepID=A0ABT9PR13_9HYPH|nr:hypothetical protein [Neorhizobium huautlense]MDP9836906.1 hypothetical protein [Neorhizobium huautlense]
MKTINTSAQAIAKPPLSPPDISLVERAFMRSLNILHLSTRDPEAVRLAALAIHLFQTGLHDEDLLRRALLEAGEQRDGH